LTHDHIAPLSTAETRAIKALQRGKATEGQQTLAMNAIVKKICGTNALPYVAGSFDQTAFRAGRAFVGARIIEIMNMKLKEDKDG